MTETRFFCTSCGNETLKWAGRCPACGEWNSLAEAPEGAEDVEDGGADGRAGRRPRPLREAGRGETPRRSSGVGELDRVLGGGVVPGSLVLLGGAPGIGKSTLLLQLAARLHADDGGALYVSGEESAGQVRMRAERLDQGSGEVPFLAETDVDRVVDAARRRELSLLCVDSVQTLHSSRSDGSPGGVSQVRECAARLQSYAKEQGVATFLVGHVTKEGGLAGPRTLEHAVDAVLRFEGQRTLEHRMLRAVKNRFGGIDEMAVFRMTSTGLDPVPNPSELFLADRQAGVSGSAVTVALQGTRPLLVEVQALTAPGRYSSPQRVSTGFPSRRLSLLLAVLERRAGLPLGEQDVFVNVVGGLQLADPAADLAVAAALVSAELDRPLPSGLAFMGEVGLGGEVRGVAQADRRVREAGRSGMDAVALPPSAAGGLDARTELREVATVSALRTLLEGDG